MDRENTTECGSGGGRTWDSEGESLRSGDYDWPRRDQEPGKRTREDAEWLKEIQRIHAGPQRGEGSPRMHRQRRKAGRRPSRKRGARLMKSHGIWGRAAKRWKRRTTDRRHS